MGRMLSRTGPPRPRGATSRLRAVRWRSAVVGIRPRPAPAVSEGDRLVGAAPLTRFIRPGTDNNLQEAMTPRLVRLAPGSPGRPPKPNYPVHDTSISGRTAA